MASLIPPPRACANPACLRSLFPAQSSPNRRRGSLADGYCSERCKVEGLAWEMRRDIAGAAEGASEASWRMPTRRATEMAREREERIRLVAPRERLEAVVTALLSSGGQGSYDAADPFSQLLLSLPPPLRALARSSYAVHGRGALRVPFSSLPAPAVEHAEFVPRERLPQVAGRFFEAVELYDPEGEAVVLVVGEERIVWAVV